MIGNKFQEIIDDISASEIATKFESNLPGTDKKKLKHVTNWITDKSWLEILWVGLTNDLYGGSKLLFLFTSLHFKLAIDKTLSKVQKKENSRIS